MQPPATNARRDCFRRRESLAISSCRRSFALSRCRSADRVNRSVAHRRRHPLSRAGCRRACEAASLTLCIGRPARGGVAVAVHLPALPSADASAVPLRSLWPSPCRARQQMRPQYPHRSRWQLPFRECRKSLPQSRHSSQLPSTCHQRSHPLRNHSRRRRCA